jgi:glycosyltransferase involved in cell wall biosynthesis
LRTAGQDISRKTKYPVYRQLIRNALRSSSLVLSQSQWEKKLLRQLCGQAIQIDVNLIGIDTTMFRPMAMQDELRQKYGLPIDAFVVVVNRYLHPPYNGWLVVKAMESLLELCSKIVLFYINPLKMDVSTKRQVESIARRCSQIRFIEGPVEHCEMAEILNCGDIYVSFSSYDGIPNSVLEAMACGVVPVVADLPQFHEWIEDGTDGYIVPQRDVDRLAATLSYLYHHRERLQRMSALSAEKVRTRAAYDNCSRRTRELLQCCAQS